MRFTVAPVVFTCFLTIFRQYGAVFNSFYYILCINTYLRTKKTNKADKRVQKHQLNRLLNIHFQLNARFSAV